MESHKNGFWKMLRIGLLIVVAHVIGIFIIGAIVFQEFTGIEIGKGRLVKNREKVKVEKYLKAKYGKEFVVIDAEIRRPELGKIKIDTTAYPKEDRKIKFRVTASPGEGGSINSFDEDYRKTFYYDTYLGKYWSKSAYEELKPVVEDIFDEDIEELKIRVGPSAYSYLEMTTIMGYTPEYEDVKKKNPKTISIMITVYIYKEEFDIKYESKRIMELIDKIREPEFDYYEIQLLYDVNGIEKVCTIRKLDIGEIQSIEDIVEEFKN